LCKSIVHWQQQQRKDLENKQFQNTHFSNFLSMLVWTITETHNFPYPFVLQGLLLQQKATAFDPICPLSKLQIMSLQPVNLTHKSK
jgi:hypothetical protein